MMVNSTSKKLFIDFVMRSALIVIIILSSIIVLQRNRFIAEQVSVHQQRITLLVDFQNTWTQVSTLISKPNQILQEDSTYLENIKHANALMDEKDLILSNFIKSDFAFQSSLKSLEKHLIIAKEYLTSTSIESNATEKLLNDTQSSLINLLKSENDKMQQLLNTNLDWLEVVIYIILGLSFWLLLLNIFVYFSSLKKLKEHEQRVLEVVDSHQEAQISENAKSEYMAMISHEIRTPMNGVLGMSNLLLNSNLNDEQKEYATSIHHSTEKLLRVVNDVLDYSKLEAGTIVLDESESEIRQMISEVVSIYTIDKKELTIKQDISTNVPKVIACDSLRLRQVLMVFLSNAVKFTNQGSIEIKCDVIDKDDKGNIKLGFKVIDTGIGIAPDKLPSLFRPFVQIGNSSARKYSGNGLGLNIAKNLIDMMKGKVKVESEVGKGSTFSFYIATREIYKPISKKNLTTKSDKVENTVITSEKVQQVEEIINSATAVPEQPMIIADTIAENEQNESLNILAVDDNEINLMLITKTLTKLGYKPKVAQNGQQAVEMANNELFDLIFMDMQMPIMDGTDATTEIRKRYRIYEYPVVIALTANALGEGREKCLEAGMQDFVVKPFKPSQIEEIINLWGERIKEYKIKYKNLTPNAES